MPKSFLLFACCRHCYIPLSSLITTLSWRTWGTCRRLWILQCSRHRHCPCGHVVGLKLPVLWLENREIWFVQGEAQFDLTGITQQRTKLHQVLVVLPELWTPSQILSSTASAAVGPEDGFKDRLLGDCMHNQSGSECLSLSTTQSWATIAPHIWWTKGLRCWR